MRLVLCLALLASLLDAQAPASAALSPMAQLLERSLREGKTGRLIVLDGPKGDWKAKVDALNLDSDWLELDLGISYYGAKAGEIESLVREKYLVGPRPSWVLVGEGGRLVASGVTVPDGANLAKVAQEGGIRSRVQLLRDFARRNPDHLQARQALSSELNKKAAIKTTLRLGGKTEPLRSADERFDYAKYQKERDAKEEAKEREQQQKEDKPPVQLKPEEDQAIWGELADLMGRCFRSGDWIEMGSWGVSPPVEALHSPLMQEVCRAAVPEVERALGRSPDSWDHWRLWLDLTRTYGGKPIRPLLDSLLPLPTLSPREWPPYAVKGAYVKDARKRKDWTGIRDLLLPDIESSRLRESIQGKTTYQMQIKTDGKVQELPETGDTWRTTLEPLVEALIWLGEGSKADELVRSEYADHPWSGLPQRAQALALRCGQPGLAAQWGALGGATAPGK